MRNTILLKTMPLLALLVLFIQPAHSACDCGSEDAANPCTGNQITVTVSASREVGFTWSIASGGQAATCGQFANGDYWIAPKAGQTEVTVAALTASGSGTVSLDENPQLETIGLLSADPNDNYGNYVAAENILSDLPLNFNNNTSLVAAIQRDESQHGGCGTSAILGNCADAYQVLTVLDQVPADAGSSLLRPSIDEQNKELLSLGDFALSRIPSLGYISPLNETAIEDIRQRWSHSIEIFSIKATDGSIYSEGGRAFRANLLVDDYAAGTASVFVSDVVSLMAADHTGEETQKAWAAILTYGKDLYFGVYDGTTRTRGWGSGAGQHLGKFPPAVLFSALFAGPEYREVLKQTSLAQLGHSEGELSGVGPQELEQINIGINGPIWGDSPDQMGRYDIGRYWSELLDSQCFDGATGECDTNGGRKNTRDPHNIIDGPPKTPGSSYMAVSAGPIRGFAALAHLIPEVCETMNYPPMIEYTDRVGDGGVLTHNDMCAPPDPREVFGVAGGCDAYRARDCEYYGLSNTGVATWGPTTFDSQPSCVPNNSGGNSGQNGRFPDMHGNPVNIGFRSLIIENNWQSIRNSAQACDLSDLIFDDGFEADT